LFGALSFHAEAEPIRGSAKTGSAAVFWLFTSRSLLL